MVSVEQNCRHLADHLVQNWGGSITHRELVNQMSSAPECRVYADDIADAYAYRSRKEAMEKALRNRNPIAPGYRTKTKDQQRFEYDAFWRGFIVVSFIVIILGFVLWKIVFNGNTTVLYIMIGILVLWAFIGFLRVIYRYGFAGVGAKYSYILSPTPSRKGDAGWTDYRSDNAMITSSLRPEEGREHAAMFSHASGMDGDTPISDQDYEAR